MSCQEILQKLADFREGALPESACAQIEAHLRDCAPCAAVDHDLRDLQRLCREAPQPCLPDSLRRRIEELIEARAKRND